MSDIGLAFPLWLVVGLALMIALPVTTALMAGLGVVAYRIRRRDPTRRLTGVKWGAIVVAPFWLVGLGYGGLTLVSEIHRNIEEAQHYFTLDSAAIVDGIALPAGTRVELDDKKALAMAELPDGATLALRGATWRGKIEFTMPAHAPNAAHGLINEGTLAATATIGGIPCRAEGQVIFFWDGALMECTLARDTDASATIAGPNGDTQSQTFRCLAGDRIDMAGLRRGEVEGCRLAEAADLGDVACAAGERILITNGSLSACTFAKPARFGPLTLPAGTSVTYYDGRASDFRLPPQGTPTDGFGLNLPPGTEGTFCYRAKTLERLVVEPDRYVVVAGVKLTRLIEFDCGEFRGGQLFEAATVGGRDRPAGDQVTRADLFP